MTLNEAFEHASTTGRTVWHVASCPIEIRNGAWVNGRGCTIEIISDAGPYSLYRIAPPNRSDMNKESK